MRHFNNRQSAGVPNHNLPNHSAREHWYYEYPDAQAHVDEPKTTQSESNYAQPSEAYCPQINTYDPYAATKKTKRTSRRGSLEVDIPRDKNAEVVRERRSRKNLYFRLRVMAYTLLIVLGLSVTGTYAYLTYTANQNANRTTKGVVEVDIYENGTTDADVVDGTKTVSLGPTGKKVVLGNDQDENRVAELVRVTFVPEVSTKANANVNEFMDSSWPADGPTTNADGTCTMTIGLVTLYFNPDWASSWYYQDGCFYYKKVLEPACQTPELLWGADWASGVDSSKYGAMRVNVIADCLQASPASAASEWGCTVASDGTVTM